MRLSILCCNLFCAAIRLFAFIPEVDSSYDRYTDNKIPDKRVKGFNGYVPLPDFKSYIFIPVFNPCKYRNKEYGGEQTLPCKEETVYYFTPVKVMNNLPSGYIAPGGE